MVALDGLAGTFDAAALDDVRIDGALTEPLGVGDELSLSIKHIDKGLAYSLALLLGVLDASQHIVEALLGVDTLHVETHIFIALKHTLELVFTQQAVVNEDAV